MQKFKVLITEDEPPALRMIKKIVEKKDGYAVAAAVKSAYSVQSDSRQKKFV